MAYPKIVIENYGINPPETARPFFGNENLDRFNEDKIITSIDLHASLQKLKPTEREIIHLINQGYSEREISSIMDINNITVHRMKDRAISKLKEMMNGKDSIHSVFTTDTECD